MTNIEPRSLFTVWSPDEVAECLDGVPADIAAALRGLVRHYDGKPRSEVPDDFGDRALSNWWGELTPEHQTILNRIAEARR